MSIKIKINRFLNTKACFVCLILAFIVLNFSTLSYGFFSKKETTTSKTIVVSSIKPLQFIVDAIVHDLNQSELLLDPNVSPHSYQMKPSDMRKLYSAKVVFWFGPELETFLEKTLTQLPENEIHVVSLFSKNKMHLHPWSNSGDHYHENDHGESFFDPHVWLDPENAIAIAKIIENTLSKLQPENATHYKKNLSHFLKTVTRIDEKNKVLFDSTKNKQFLAFHDSWGYFSNHYKLATPIVFSISPHKQPGAQHIEKLYSILDKSLNENICVLVEPQFNPSYLKNAITKYNLNRKSINLMANDIKEGPDAYFYFLDKMAKDVHSCLVGQ